MDSRMHYLKIAIENYVDLFILMDQKFQNHLILSLRIEFGENQFAKLVLLL